MPREKKYLVCLHYRKTNQRRSENPKVKELITSVESWDTILPFSAKDDGAACEMANGFTNQEGRRAEEPQISLSKGSGRWRVKFLWTSRRKPSVSRQQGRWRS